MSVGGQAIGSQPVGEAGPRELASELGGARPAAVRQDARAVVASERITRAARP